MSHYAIVTGTVLCCWSLLCTESVPQRHQSLADCVSLCHGNREGRLRWWWLLLCTVSVPFQCVSLCHRRRYAIAGHCCAQNQSLSVSLCHRNRERVGYAAAGYWCAQYQSLHSVHSHYAIVTGTVLSCWLLLCVACISPWLIVSHYAIVTEKVAYAAVVIVVHSISPCTLCLSSSPSSLGLRKS